MPKSVSRGFTLVELLVVISIIAILSVIGITVFSSAQKSGRDAKRRMDLKAIAGALEQYKIINSSYPTNATNWAISSSAQPWIPGLSSSYINSVPQDPTNTGGCPCRTSNTGDFLYAYWAAGYGASDGTWYMLVAHLESPSSADLKTKCTAPDGTTFGSNSSGATNIYSNTFMVCNQQ